MRRIEAWTTLSQSGDPSVRTRPNSPTFPGRRRPGIWGSSRVYWENMLGGTRRTPKFTGMVWKDGRVIPGRLNLPSGPLVVSKRIDSFTCDLTDIQGITASRSEDRHFDSVHDFGQDFCVYEQAEVTEAGLASMLRWFEVRLINSPGSDHLCIALWDPRLHVANGGGSHHLAGAAFISRRLGKAVPIEERLIVSAFNPKAWARLLEEYWVLQEPPKAKGWHRHAVAELLGCCFIQKIPESLGGGNLILLPRHNAASADVVSVLVGRGAMDVSANFVEILRVQESAIVPLCERLPQLAPHLTDIAAWGDANDH